MFAVPAMLVSAKTVQFSLPLLLIVAFAGALTRTPLHLLTFPRSSAAIGLFVLLLYAAFTSAWAPAPQAAFLIASMAATVTAGSLVLAQILSRESFADSLHIVEGLWIGLLIGLIYTVIEVVTDQAMKITVYNALGLGPQHLEPARYFSWEQGRLIAVHPDDLKRNAFSIPLLIWPALLATTLLASPAWRGMIGSGLLTLGLTAVLLGPSQTNKLALCAGLLAYFAARLWPRLTQAGLLVAWLAACLGVVPAAILARQAELHNVHWLGPSAQLRIVIWDHIAHLVPLTPLLGVGADMTYVIRPRLTEAPLSAQDWIGFPIPHAHNLYLQTWYELGFVGALLLATVGILLIAQLAKRGEVEKPYGYALFAAAAVAASASYNPWQIWFMCSLGFAVAVFSVAAHAVQLASLPPRLLS